MEHQLNQTKVVNKPRAVNVFLLPKSGERIDLTDSGLMSLTFDRYLNIPANQASGILQTLDISLYSKSGNDLVGLLQRQNSNLYLQYGFEGDELSPVYDLQIIKLNVVRQDTGKAIAIGAIGTEEQKQFPAEIYKQGAKISDILHSMAERNGWQTDIDCNLSLPTILLKEPDTYDWNFIQDKLLPLANKSVITNNIDYNSSLFWEAKLVKTGPLATLHFRPKNKRGGALRIWRYEYGTSPSNEIISYTQQLDLSHLIKGLNIQISTSSFEKSLTGSDTLQKQINRITADLSEQVKAIHKKYNVPMLGIDKFKFNVKLVEEVIPEESDIVETLTTKILEAIEKAVSVINTIELTVIGNPSILPTDLVELVIKDIDGTYDWFTTPSGSSTYWKVVGIREEIGLSGYTTKLNLVKEVLGD